MGCAAMPGASKALILNDYAYVSPYLMRPLRRLDEVERSTPDSNAKPAANDSKPQRRPAPDRNTHATPAAGMGRR